MKIRQWEDKGLAQFSYAILSECESKIVLIDPSRNPQPYLDYAKENNATIIGIIETHPHADFVSSHLELHNITGAPVYTHSLVNPLYPFIAFDEGMEISFGKIRLYPLHTPGHSPDSICIVLEHDRKPHSVFTGDTLFIGDCGRPDLRESAGNLKAKRESLALQMYHSLRMKLATLPDDVIVYPAHGAGTLCGKSLSNATASTIGQEKESNWSLQSLTEKEFIKQLLADQPFIPAYFPFSVEQNRKGLPPFRKSIDAVSRGAVIRNPEDISRLDPLTWIIDARDESSYKLGHLPHSINLMEGERFETWLGSMISPGEKFYLAASSAEQLERLIERAAAIGYESQIREAFIVQYGEETLPELDLESFRKSAGDYTVVDVRNEAEVKMNRIFPGSISIPLGELRTRVAEVPTGKPVVVHCAGGYRSAAASSFIHSYLKGRTSVFDLSEKIREF